MQNSCENFQEKLLFYQTKNKKFMFLDVLMKEIKKLKKKSFENIRLLKVKAL
jgi:hypothetical protein